MFDRQDQKHFRIGVTRRRDILRPLPSADRAVQGSCRFPVEYNDESPLGDSIG